MVTILFIVQAILAVALTLAILLQVKGQGFSGSFGGDSGSIFRTRRGVEKLLFNWTIGLAVAFMALALITSIFAQ